MKKLGREIYAVFVTAWDGFWLIWVADLLWLFSSLLIVPFTAACAGLFFTMRELAYGEPVDWKTFFYGMKKYMWAGYRWFVFNFMVIGLLVFYMWFFSAAREDWGQVISGIPAGLMVLWGLLNLLTLPMMMEQVKPSYLLALRNSLILFLKWPWHTLGFTVVIFAILALSTWLRFPWAILGASMPALLACVCIKNKTEEVRKSLSETDNIKLKQGEI